MNIIFFSLSKRIYITIIILAGLWQFDILPCSAQKNLSILGDEQSITIPFLYSQGFIIIDVTFYHIFPMKFILDTGAEHSILLNKTNADIMNVPYEKEVKILGADISYGLKAWVVRNIPIQLSQGKKILHDMIVLEEDIMNLGAITGIKVDGILGAEFLKHFIVEIDYKNLMVKIHHPESKRTKWRSFEQVALETYFNKPYLRTEVRLNTMQPSQPNLLLLDTGAALSLLLHLEKDSLYNLPSNIVEGVIGKGLGGDLTGYSGMVSCLEMGESRFNNLVTSFQSFDSIYPRQDKIIREGIIGNFLLDQFHVVFDFPSHQLFLKKRSKKGGTFRMDRSGIVVHAFGDQFNQYYIHQVLKGSPAEKSGLQEGDIIKKMGMWPSGFLSLEKINLRLTSQSKSIHFTIERNGVKMKKMVMLRDIYHLKP